MIEKKQVTEEISKIVFLMNSSRLDRYTYVGITIDMILSKDIFAANKNIEPFLQDIYNLKFKEYVISSRTNICARLIRHLTALSDEELKKSKMKIVEYLDQYFEGIKNDTKNTNSNDNYSKWLKGIK